MTSNLLDWDEDLQTSPDEEYQALLNGLRRSQGFGLYFVQCSPFSGGKLIERVQADLTEKTIGVLKFEQPIIDGNVFKRVSDFLSDSPVDALFIQGLENSLFDAEETKKRLGWSAEKANAYTWREVPPVLINLNQQRERFRDSFATCFVFLLPQYAINYIVHRAPDFFDWRSGLVNYASNVETLAQESERILAESDYNAYCSWSDDELNARIFEIQAIIDEAKTTPQTQAKLCFEQGLIFAFAKDFFAAATTFGKAFLLKPDYHEALNNKGIALIGLGQYDDAITTYDQALTLKPDFPDPLNNKGIALSALGQSEAAIAAYDKALTINPDSHEVLCNKGIALRNLGQYEDAITCFDAALAINPGLHEALKNKGIALRNLGRYEAAIACYDDVLSLNPDDYEALNNKGVALAHSDQYEAALTCFNAALAIKSDFYEALYHKGGALSDLGQYEAAIACFNASLDIEPDKHKVLTSRGKAYLILGCQEQAKADFNRAAEMGSYDPITVALSFITELRSNQNKEAAYASLLKFIQLISSPNLLNKLKQQSPQTHSASSKTQLIKQSQAFAQTLGLDPTEIQSQLEKTSDDPEVQLQDLQAISLLLQADLAFEQGNYEAAIAAYDQALTIKPNYYQALNNKGMALGRLGQHEVALGRYDAALAIKPDYHYTLYAKGNALFELGDKVGAITCYDAALAIKLDYHDALNHKGMALGDLGHYEAAIACYDAALKIKPDYHDALYNKACYYSLYGDADNAIQCLQTAIALATKWLDLAKTDTDFDPIRTDERFQALLEGE